MSGVPPGSRMLDTLVPVLTRFRSVVVGATVVVEAGGAAVVVEGAVVVVAASATAGSANGTGSASARERTSSVCRHDVVVSPLVGAVVSVLPAVAAPRPMGRAMAPTAAQAVVSARRARRDRPSVGWGKRGGF